MQHISLFIALLGCLYIFERFMNEPDDFGFTRYLKLSKILKRIDIRIKYKIRNLKLSWVIFINRLFLKFLRLSNKLLGCMFCISFWLGVALSLLVCNYFISLPLVYRVIQVKLLR